MTSDPLKVFQTTYAQAVANGLPTGAAQLAAQTAMASATNQQNSRSATVAQPVQAVHGGRVTDGGPTMAAKRSK